MMKVILTTTLLITAILFTTTCENVDNPLITQSSQQLIDIQLTKKSDCTTIQDGTLLTSAGDVIVLGYDEWGYNYQAHIFNGGYCDAYRDAAWCQSYKDIELQMKWNDAWLSNKDCDGDNLLDRHYGFDSYIGSGAWLTNHMRGGEGKNKWTYFVKIVAPPGDAYEDSGIWYTADGTEIGPVIWGAFAVIQEVISGVGATYVSPAGPGLGKY